MNKTHDTRTDARSASDGTGDPTRTPSTDMQAPDAGTPDGCAASGGPRGTAQGGDVGARSTPAEAVMKQEHKTKHESGSRGA